MNETDKRLDDALELLSEFDERLTALEDAPPAGAWAQSVAWLIREFVTTRNVAKVAAGLATIYLAVAAAINGVPGV